MPDPTIEQIKNNLRQQGGRADLVVAEIMRLQTSLLPTLIADINSEGELYGLKLPVPDKFLLQGEAQEPAKLPLIISVSKQGQPQGVRGAQDSIHVQLTMLFEPPASLVGILNAFVLADLQWGILSCVQGAWKDPRGRVAWSQLNYAGAAFEDSFPKRWGVTLHVQATVYRGGNKWEIQS